MLAALWWPPELVGFTFLFVHQCKVRNFSDCAFRWNLWRRLRGWLQNPSSEYLYRRLRHVRKDLNCSSALAVVQKQFAEASSLVHMQVCHVSSASSIERQYYGHSPGRLWCSSERPASKRRSSKEEMEGRRLRVHSEDLLSSRAWNSRFSCGWRWRDTRSAWDQDMYFRRS